MNELGDFLYFLLHLLLNLNVLLSKLLMKILYLKAEGDVLSSLLLSSS